MNPLTSILFLAVLGGLALFLYLILVALDILQTTAVQKIRVLQLGFLMLLTAPFLFLVLHAISLQTIELPSIPISLDPSLPHSSALLPIHQGLSWPSWILLIYGVGASFMLARLILKYFMTLKWLANSQSHVLQGQSVQINTEIDSPLSFGIIRPQIYVPEQFQEKWSAREIQLSFAHERNHIKNQDPFWKLISLIAQSLLFFVPWAYALHRKLELEMEIRCDEETCTETQAGREEYGLLLLAMIHQSPSKCLLVTNMTDSTLKRRILAMKSRKIQRPLLISFVTTLVFFLGTAAIATASGLTQKKQLFKVSSIIYVNGEKVSKPAFVTAADETATIQQTSKDGSKVLTIEVVANDVTTPTQNNAIGLSYSLRYKNGDSEGHEIFHVILTPGKEGDISFSDHAGQTYDMKIVATRQ